MKAIEGWKSITLGEICKFAGGNGFRDELQGRRDGDYPFIKVSDMELPANKKTIVEANNWIDEKTKVNEAFKAFPKDSVVFAKVGAALLLNRRRILTKPTCIDNNMMAAVPNGIDPLFLFYKLSEIDFADFVQSGAVPSINQGQLSCISFELPQSKPEQTKIAEVLSTVDQAIEQTEALIAKQQRIKTGLMQDLLTRGIDEEGNLRSEQTHEFKDSPLGRIPVEWEVEPFGGACDRVSVGIATSTTKHFRTEGIPLLRNQNVLSGQFDITDLLYISYQFDEVNKSKRVRVDDLVTMRTGYPGRTAVVSKSMIGWQTFTTLISTPKKSKYVSEFLCLQINSFVGRKQITTLQGGGAQQNLNVGWIVNMQVIRPSINEQERIVNILTTMDSGISGGVSQLKKLRSLKTGLMQDLLTGKKRVTALLHDTEVVHG